ncbi:D-alanyl-D-alanine carboxypeptidase family protein [Flexivirga caeni]|uniref:D-alanyl-D-alanine carboxypeptidase-like core domain-containing protein n=1 Tax=Flexivirga caeni TaxID=2294115 RepID=A0A3M9M579_9MICO|nr:D-alanyl-D-alanine carboxypeptidase family protein [Flexivirga caeni]RNI20709.1 hypothetical protein EFY87_14095 [Flexivirga caeni]
MDDAPAEPTTRYVVPGIDNLHVRMGSGTSYPVVGVLVPDARVVGIGAGDWLQITQGPLRGACVSSAYLTPDAPPEQPGTPCPRLEGRVTSDDQFANVRSGPSFGHPVVGRCQRHEAVSGSLVGQGPWIRTDRGYVNGGTLTFHTGDPTTINGRISERLLAPIPLHYNASGTFEPGYGPTTIRYLNDAALEALHLLQRSFRRRFGHYATIDLTYRSYAEQEFWFERFGSPRAADPGTSNHGYGLAIDFEERDVPWRFSWGAPANDWLLTHQAGFGFDNPYAATLQHGEDYHFNFVG